MCQVRVILSIQALLRFEASLKSSIAEMSYRNKPLDTQCVLPLEVEKS